MIENKKENMYEKLYNNLNSNKMKQITLEPSNNPHVIESKKEMQIVDQLDSTLQIKTNDVTMVTHGEHGTITINSPIVLKCVQKEVNPLTGIIENAND